MANLKIMYFEYVSQTVTKQGRFQAMMAIDS